MALSFNSSGVYQEERIFQNALLNSALTVGCMMVVSSRGPLEPVLCSGEEDFISQYGVPKPELRSHYGALGYFSEGQYLYTRRVVGAGYAYSGLLLQNKDAGSGRALTLLPYGSNVVEENDFPWNTAGTASGPDDNVLYIVATGPGSYGDQIAVRILSGNILAPGNFAAARLATGGILGTGSYSYRITAYNKQGETAATTAVTATASAGTTNAIRLTWNEVSGAAGYKVYGRTAGSERLIANVGTGLGTYLDTGSLTPNAAIAAPSSTTIVQSNAFDLQVFDLSINETVPSESYSVSFERSSDGFGAQTEITERINTSSRLIRVLSNVENLVNVPVPKTLQGSNQTPIAFGGGNSGATPTRSDIITALGDFEDPEEYDFNILIEGGIASTGDVVNWDGPIKQAMVGLLAKRGYGVAFLDVPSLLQQYQDALDYRLRLGIDSDRGAIFVPDVIVTDVYNNITIYAPQSGYSAARAAYTDVVANPGRSIAGLNRGIMPIQGVRHIYKQAQRDILAPASLNYIRKFPGRYALWEQRTMTIDFKVTSFLSVRRIVDVIEQTIKRFLLTYVHEPQDDITVLQIIGLINQYLQSLRQLQVINKYQVTSITSNFEKQIGLLNIDLFLEPTLPIEKIRLRTNIVQQGSDISAIVQQATASG